MSRSTTSGLFLESNQSEFRFNAVHSTDGLIGAFEHIGTCFLKLRENVPTSTVQESVMHSRIATFVNEGGKAFVNNERFVVFREDGVVSWALDLSVSDDS